MRRPRPRPPAPPIAEIRERSPTDRRPDVDLGYCRKDGRNELGRAVRRDVATALRAQPRQPVLCDRLARVRRGPCSRHSRPFGKIATVPPPKAARTILSGPFQVKK